MGTISGAIHGVKFGDTGHAMLINSDGTSLMCPLLFNAAHAPKGEIMKKLISQGGGWMVIPEDWHGWKDPLIGFSPVYFPYDIGSIDSEEKRWYILVLQDPAEIFSPFFRLFKKLGAIGLAVIGLLVVFGYYNVQKIVNPILLLKKKADRIGAEYSEDLSSGAFQNKPSEPVEFAYADDEIQILSRAFNRMAENLRGAKERLITMERLSFMGNFAAIAAHEIRNPLNAIKNSAIFLKSRLSNQGKERKSMEIIAEEVEKLDQFVQRILVFSRKPDIHPSRVDIRRMMEDILSSFSHENLLQGIQLEKKFDPDAPDLMLDRDLIRQVLVNLVRNAIEAMRGEGKLEIRITCSASGLGAGAPIEDGRRYLRIEISDSGPGILPEERQHLFKPFYTTKDKGVGIGLAFSYFVIASHHGILDVKSEPGKGATFFILIPILKHETDHSSDR